MLRFIPLWRWLCGLRGGVAVADTKHAAHMGGERRARRRSKRRRGWWSTGTCRRQRHPSPHLDGAAADFCAAARQISARSPHQGAARSATHHDAAATRRSYGRDETVSSGFAQGRTSSRREAYSCYACGDKMDRLNHRDSSNGDTWKELSCGHRQTTQ